MKIMAEKDTRIARRPCSEWRRDGAGHVVSLTLTTMTKHRAGNPERVIGSRELQGLLG